MSSNLQVFESQQIIPVKENDTGEVVVSGRDLHEFLEIKTEYKKWFSRMTEYGFSENEDYIRVSQKCPTHGGIQEITDHAIKLDMAKEIAMIQRNENGKQARQYFIQVEKAWNSPEMIMKRALEIANRRVERLQLANQQKDQLIGELKPRADYTDSILKNPGLVTITQIAKDYGMSGNKMNEVLHDLGVQYKQSGQWLLYSQHHDKGYTHSETVSINRSDGRKDVKMNTKWTQKGRLFLYDLLKQHGILPNIENPEDEAACTEE